MLPPKFVFPIVIEACQSVLAGEPFDTSGKKNPLWEDIEGKVEAPSIDLVPIAWRAEDALMDTHPEAIRQSGADDLAIDTHLAHLNFEEPEQGWDAPPVTVGDDWLPVGELDDSEAAAIVTTAKRIMAGAFDDEPTTQTTDQEAP